LASRRKKKGRRVIVKARKAKKKSPGCRTIKGKEKGKEGFSVRSPLLRKKKKTGAKLTNSLGGGQKKGEGQGDSVEQPAAKEGRRRKKKKRISQLWQHYGGKKEKEPERHQRAERERKKKRDKRHLPLLSLQKEGRKKKNKGVKRLPAEEKKNGEGR